MPAPVISRSFLTSFAVTVAPGSFIVFSLGCTRHTGGFVTIQIGFNRAWPSIRDGNISTFIISGILYWFGSQFAATAVTGFALGIFVLTVVTLTQVASIPVTASALNIMNLMLGSVVVLPRLRQVNWRLIALSLAGGLPDPDHWPKVSVVVAARNEAERIEACLESLRASDYPDLELILVNDRSEDNTGEIMNRLASVDNRIHVIDVTELATSTR